MKIFTTKEVEIVIESAINNGALLLKEAVTKPSVQKVGNIRGLNGFKIEIRTPIPNQK